MPPSRRPALVAALAAVLALTVPAGAGASSWATTSTNWAGYAASRPGVGFRHVSGTWVAPAAHCGSGTRRYSAAWLGLGGLHTTSRALEQVGTEADCAGGKGYYSAWYELVPAAPVRLALTVRPGDTMSAAVTVSGHLVKLFIADRTQGTSFSKQLRVDQVDVSSAEWIVEAPSACVDNGGCRALPLADFGTTSFANAEDDERDRAHRHDHGPRMVGGRHQPVPPPAGPALLDPRRVGHRHAGGPDAGRRWLRGQLSGPRGRRARGAARDLTAGGRRPVGIGREEDGRSA